MPLDTQETAQQAELTRQLERLADSTRQILDQHARQLEHQSKRDIKLAEIEGEVKLIRAESKAQAEGLSKEIFRAATDVTSIREKVDTMTHAHSTFGERIMQLESWRGVVDSATKEVRSFRRSIQLAIIGACCTLAVTSIIALVAWLVRPVAVQLQPRPVIEQKN